MAKKKEDVVVLKDEPLPIPDNPFDGLMNLDKELKQDQKKVEELKRKTFLAEKAQQYEEISEYLVKKFGIKFKSYQRNKDIDSVDYDFNAVFEDGATLTLAIRGNENEN